MTDEWPGYRGIEKRYRHHTVNHSAGEYVKNYFAHVNGIESMWALLKRQVYGIHHWVSKRHLHRYIDEAVWRFNRRKVVDGHRVSEFSSRVDGRLKYRVLIAKA